MAKTKKELLSMERHCEICAFAKELEEQLMEGQLVSIAVELRRCNGGTKASNRLIKVVDVLREFRAEAQVLLLKILPNELNPKS